MVDFSENSVRWSSSLKLVINFLLVESSVNSSGICISAVSIFPKRFMSHWGGTLGTKYLKTVVENPYSKTEGVDSKLACRQRRFYCSRVEIPDRIGNCLNSLRPKYCFHKITLFMKAQITELVVIESRARRLEVANRFQNVAQRPKRVRRPRICRSVAASRKPHETDDLLLNYKYIIARHLFISTLVTIMRYAI